MKFKVGDRVRIVSAPFGFDGSARKLIGKTVTLIAVDNDSAIFSLCGHYYTWKLERFEPICNQKILITTDGKETKARLYEGKALLKEAVAKCHPDDEFNFKFGASLAFNRVFGEGYSSKIVCIESKNFSWTVGKIYMVRCGELWSNCGDLLSNIKSIEELNAKCTAKFIELVED